VNDIDRHRSHGAFAPVPEASAFEAAWREFTGACADTVAPEATYQAWLAHFVIRRVGLLRVVREVDFGARHLGPAAAERFSGHNLMVDLLIPRGECPARLRQRAVLRVSGVAHGMLERLTS
jgi:hypothetical protein